jgi:RNA polymerase sigma factor (sigma-70 family)
MSLTYEELIPVLKTIARKYTSHKYDFWELINAVWEMGRIQKLSDIRFAWNRVTLDMIDYMRTQEGRRIWDKRCKRHGEPNWKKRTKFHSYDVPVDQSDDLGDSFQENIKTIDCSYGDIDFNDELKLLVRRSCNNPRDRLVFRLRLEGYNMKEISEMVGCDQSRISQILTCIGKDMLKVIAQHGIGYGDLSKTCLNQK